MHTLHTYLNTPEFCKNGGSRDTALFISTVTEVYGNTSCWPAPIQFSSHTMPERGLGTRLDRAAYGLLVPQRR